MRKLAPVLVAAALLPGVAHAETCQDYPNTDGVSVEAAGELVKIISTGSAGVTADDIAAVQDARTEATLMAKAGISRFLSEGIQSAETVDRAVQETKSMQGPEKTALRKETADRVLHLSSSSSALLRGVVMLGECYTPGREFRVSVGVKPETIRGAAQVSDQTNPGVGVANRMSTTQPLGGVDGFSRSEGIKKF